MDCANPLNPTAIIIVNIVTNNASLGEIVFFMAQSFKEFDSITYEKWENNISFFEFMNNSFLK